MDSRVSISPGDFAKLVLPVYKVMLIDIPTMATLGLMTSPTQRNPLGAIINPKHYTSASFARLISVASRRLNLDEAHFGAALDCDITEGGLMLAPNFLLEKVSNESSMCMIIQTQILPTSGVVCDFMHFFENVN